MICFDEVWSEQMELNNSSLTGFGHSVTTPKSALKQPKKRLKSSSAKRSYTSSTPLDAIDIEDLNLQRHPLDRSFTEDEAANIKIRLLNWYDRNHRKLPWRENSHSLLEPAMVRSRNEAAVGGGSKKEEDLDGYRLYRQQRAYAVWVSEIMLQQTRVATVVDYFNRWMEKWPTVQHLAQANEEEVNALWAGLGYYRRARYLLEGARYIVQEQKGLLPSTTDGLQKVPGVGNYTAGAIASIAFKQQVPVVDGNVVRVLCRLRAISANPKESATIKLLWTLARQLVDAQRPGDFNEALMELGATICTSVSPACASCPIAQNCKALLFSKESENKSKKNSRSVQSLLVTDFPTKVVKASPRNVHVAVCVVERITEPITRNQGGGMADDFYLLVKRPQNGLLAGLWEFPSVSLDGPDVSCRKKRAVMDHYLTHSLGLQIGQGSSVVIAREAVGDYVHVFSHIHMHMSIEWLLLSQPDGNVIKQGGDLGQVLIKWVHVSAIEDIGLTSGVKKVYQMLQNIRGSKLKAFFKGRKVKT